MARSGTGGEPPAGESTSCAACAKAVDAAREPVVLCEACLRRHHAGCFQARCGACGSTSGLGPILPGARRPVSVTPLGRFTPPPRPRGWRVRWRRVALVAALGATVGAAALHGQRRSDEERARRLAEAGLQTAVAQLERDLANGQPAPLAYDWTHQGADDWDLTQMDDVVSWTDDGFEPTAAGLVAAALDRTAKGDHAGAVEDATRAIALDPALADGWAARGAARRALGDHAAAASDLTEALRRRTDVAGWWADRALSRQLLGDHGGAVQDATQALALDARLARAWSARAGARVALGDLLGARSDLGQLLAVTPQEASGWQQRGRLLLQLGDPSGAAHDFLRGLELEPAGPHAVACREGLGRALHALRSRWSGLGWPCGGVLVSMGGGLTWRPLGRSAPVNINGGWLVGGGTLRTHLSPSSSWSCATDHDRSGYGECSKPGSRFLYPLPLCLECRPCSPGWNLRMKQLGEWYECAEDATQVVEVPSPFPPVGEGH